MGGVHYWSTIRLAAGVRRATAQVLFVYNIDADGIV